jgi:hypothetical protein
MHAKTLILSLACHGKHSETTQTAREALQAIGINSDRLTTTERPGSTQHNGERLRMHGQHSTQPKFRMRPESTRKCRRGSQNHCRLAQNTEEALRSNFVRPFKHADSPQGDSECARNTQNTQQTPRINSETKHSEHTRTLSMHQMKQGIQYTGENHRFESPRL